MYEEMNSGVKLPIDRLVEFEKEAAPSLGGMVGIQDAFAELFGGCKVNIVVLHPDYSLTHQKIDNHVA